MAKIRVTPSDVNDFLNTYNNVTDGLLDSVDTLIRNFNTSCDYWRDDVRNEFENELLNLQNEIKVFVQDSEEDKAFLRRLLVALEDLANTPPIGRR